MGKEVFFFGLKQGKGQGSALGVSKLAPVWEFCTKEEGKGTPF
jgi:hypothetical protein